MPAKPSWNHSSIWARIMWFLDAPRFHCSPTVVNPSGFVGVGCRKNP
jgi:hypothetical protein